MLKYYNAKFKSVFIISENWNTILQKETLKHILI